jgi:phage-related protein
MNKREGKIMEKMIYQEYVDAMNFIIADKDTERAHRRADNLLIEFLKEEGYVELIEAYEKVNKWYA